MKKDIKIQGTKLYLKGNLCGSIVDYKFISNSHLENTQVANQEPAPPPTVDDYRMAQMFDGAKF